MRQDIRFAGIALNWSSEYVQSYSDKLIEMGYCAKVLPLFEIVAYSYRPFSRMDAEEAYRELQQEKDI